MEKKTPEDKETKQYLTLEASFENWEEQSVDVKFRFAKPSKPMIERTNKDIQKNKGTSALQNLLLSIVHPEEKEDLKEKITEHPGLIQSFTDTIYERLGYNSVGK